MRRKFSRGRFRRARRGVAKRRYGRGRTRMRRVRGRVGSRPMRIGYRM